MQGIYDGFGTISPKGSTFFAGANTGRGFRSSYPEFIREKDMERVYIIKGGSGTGKSTLMRRIAEMAEGHGVPVRYYACGSDPSSLDAVVLAGRIAVLDGTSPHTMEMGYPGASSSLIDVSRFWDEDRLAQHKEELIHHSAEKAGAYQSAYRYLKGAEALEEEIRQTAVRAVDFPKLNRYAERTAKRFCGRKGSEQGTVSSVYTHGVTMTGCRTLLPTDGQTVIGIKDSFGTADFLLRALGDAAVRRGTSVEYGLFPLNDRASRLMLSDVTLAVGLTGERTISMHRFLDSDAITAGKDRLRATEKCIRTLLREAEACLGHAAEAHFAMEEIYKSAMDFRALNRYGKQVIQGIEAKLTTS